MPKMRSAYRSDAAAELKTLISSKKKDIIHLSPALPQVFRVDLDWLKRMRVRLISIDDGKGIVSGSCRRIVRSKRKLVGTKHLNLPR